MTRKMTTAHKFKIGDKVAFADQPEWIGRVTQIYEGSVEFELNSDFGILMAHARNENVIHSNKIN